MRIQAIQKEIYRRNRVVPEKKIKENKYKDRGLERQQDKLT